jgi:hypothetical protein
VSQILATSFNNSRIYPSLRDCRHTARISDSERGNRRETQAHGHCNDDCFRDPAFAVTSDYESMHKRLADVLGSRAQADAAYDKLMKEADTYGQPLDAVVDLFIAVCTASDECNP